MKHKTTTSNSFHLSVDEGVAIWDHITSKLSKKISFCKVISLCVCDRMMAAVGRSEFQVAVHLLSLVIAGIVTCTHVPMLVNLCE